MKDHDGDPFMCFRRYSHQYSLNSDRSVKREENVQLKRASWCSFPVKGDERETSIRTSVWPIPEDDRPGSTKASQCVPRRTVRLSPEGGPGSASSVPSTEKVGGSFEASECSSGSSSDLSLKERQVRSSSSLSEESRRSNSSSHRNTHEERPQTSKTKQVWGVFKDPGDDSASSSHRPKILYLHRKVPKSSYAPGHNGSYSEGKGENNELRSIETQKHTGVVSEGKLSQNKKDNKFQGNYKFFSKTITPKQESYRARKSLSEERKSGSQGVPEGHQPRVRVISFSTSYSYQEPDPTFLQASETKRFHLALGSSGSSEESVVETDSDSSYSSKGDSEIFEQNIEDDIEGLLANEGESQLRRKLKCGGVPQMSSSESESDLLLKTDLQKRPPEAPSQSELLLKTDLRERPPEAPSQSDLLLKSDIASRVDVLELEKQVGIQGRVKLTENERKETLQRSLVWLKRELKQMRSQDQILAGKFLHLTTEFRRLRSSSTPLPVDFADPISVPPAKSCDIEAKRGSYSMLHNIGIQPINFPKLKLSLR